MPFSDYSADPTANTSIGDGIYIGPNMARNDVREALQQLAADGRVLADLLTTTALTGKYYSTVTEGAIATSAPNTFVSDESGSMSLYDEAGVVLVDDIFGSQESFTQSGVGAVPRTIQEKARDTVSVADFGAIGDGVTNDYAAFLAAHEALPANGGTILLPATTANAYYMGTNTLNIRKKIRLVGGGPAQGTGTQGCKMVWDAGCDGIIFNNYITLGRAVVASDPAYPGSSGSEVENIMFLGSGGAGNYDGVVLRTPAHFTNCHARNWPRDGFHIRADIGGGTDLEGDANGWTTTRCSAVLNGRHGFFAQGADANVGVATRCFVTLNTGWGYYDDTFIGCSWIGCDSAGNGLGCMWAANATQETTVVGMWEDDNLDTSEFGGGVSSFGGNGGIPSATSTGFHQSRGLAQWAPYRYINSRGSQQIGAQLGALGTVKAAISFGAITDEGSLTAWSFEYDDTNKCWRYEFANSSAFHPIALINSASTAYTNKGLTGPIFQNGYGVKNSGTAEGSAKVRLLGSAAPVSGTFQVGDIVYNSAPAAGGKIGWVCTTAGSPGTWKPFGAIDA